MLPLPEVGYGEVLIADHKTHLALIRLSPHVSAKLPKGRLIICVLDVFRHHVTVQDNGIVSNQLAVVLVIAPDTLRFWVGCSSTEHPTEQLKRLMHPLILVDLCDPIPLNAWNEEHD